MVNCVECVCAQWETTLQFDVISHKIMSDDSFKTVLTPTDPFCFVDQTMLSKDRHWDLATSIGNSNDTETKWPPSGRRHYKTHFWMKICVFWFQFQWTFLLIDNKSALIQVMALCRIGDTLLPELIMTINNDHSWRHYVTISWAITVTHSGCIAYD